MRRPKLSRLEWALFLLPSSLLLLCYLDRFRTLDSSQLILALNPYARVVGNKRMSNCQSNLKQLSFGMLQYLQDYDDGFPNNSSPTCNWVPTLMPYAFYYGGQDGILHCPEAQTRSFMQTDYWMNANLNDSKGRGLKRTGIVAPTRTFLFGDGDEASRSLVMNEKSWSSQAPYAGRHLRGANYAFLDGHAKWLSSDEERALQWKSPQSSLYSWKTK